VRSKFIAGTLLVFFVTSMFNSQSAFAGGIPDPSCLDLCDIEADDVFESCFMDTGDATTCDELAEEAFASCVQLCPNFECLTDSECGIPTACSVPICLNLQCLTIDVPLSTPCEFDGDLCTIDHCDGLGSCVPFAPVECDAGDDVCSGGLSCKPSTGTCEGKPNAPLSTPCELDGDLCTIDHCDGLGSCVNLAPNPVCEQQVGGVQLPLDNTSLLLAGAQMNAAWMIPVLLSGIGIGLFVVSRKSENS